MWASFILIGLSPASVRVDKEKSRQDSQQLNTLSYFMVSPSFCAEAHQNVEFRHDDYPKSHHNSPGWQGPSCLFTSSLLLQVQF